MRSEELPPRPDPVRAREEEKKHLPWDNSTSCACPGARFQHEQKGKGNTQDIKDIGDVASDGSGLPRGKAWASRGWESKLGCE